MAARIEQDLSIVIPVHNEKESISDTLSRCIKLREVEQFREIEILVIDDASTDGTSDQLNNYDVTIVRHPAKAGYGQSLKDGIRNARFDTIVITDADGTYPIESIVELVDLYEDGFNMIVGARTGPHYRAPGIRSPLRSILRWIVEFIVGETIPDINSGLRVFSKNEVTPYLRRLCNTFSFTTSLTLAYYLTQKFVTYVPITYSQRIGSTKTKVFKDSLRTLQYIVQIVLYYNPIKIFLLLCVFNTLLGTIGFLVGVMFKLQVGYYFAFFSIFSTMLWFVLGLLAEQLGQILSPRD